MPEVNKESKFLSACCQIIHQLPLMFRSKVGNSLQFHNNDIFYNHIRHIMAYYFIFIINIYRFLTFTFQPYSGQFLIQSIAIYRLPNAKAQFSMYLLRRTYYFLCYFLIQHKQIRVNPCNPCQKL